MRRGRANRSAFSIFGLIVLLAILAILLALLLPALQRVREAATRMRCANNLRQIGIAAHNYHGDYNRLPPGYLGPIPDFARLSDKEQNISCLVLLLPYLEQDNLFKQLEINASVQQVGPAWWRDARNVPNNKTAATTVIKVFRCPSDAFDLPKVGTIAAFHNIGLNMEAKILDAPDAVHAGITNYTGVAGCIGQAALPDKDLRPLYLFEGMLTNRSSHTLGQITVQDGTSNSLMFGEGLGGAPVAPRDRAWSWMGVGAMVTYYGLARKPAEEDPPTAQYRFGSMHANGVQFCFGDASVRTIRWGQTAKIPAKEDWGKPMANDWFVFQQLAGFKDGMNFDTSALVD